MHNFVAACTCLLAVCATARASDVARKTDDQIKYRPSRSLVVPHWDRFNPMDNAPFDLNGPAADSQVDALPSAHWPYRARYPAAAAASPPNTFPVPFESIYHPVYAPTADAFRRLSTDEIELFEHLTAVRDLLRKLDGNAAPRRDTVSSTVASSTYSSSTRSPENPIVPAADATLKAGDGGQEQREESVWPTADEPGEDPGKAFDEYKELYAMYLRRENAAEDGGAGLRKTEAEAEAVDADWTAATADAETAAAGGTSAPEFDNVWAPAVADRQRMAEAQDGGGGGDGNVYRYVLGDRGLRIRLMDDEAAAAERLGGYGVLQAVDGRGEKESMDGGGDDDDDIDVVTSGRADDAK